VVFYKPRERREKDGMWRETGRLHQEKGKTTEIVFGVLKWGQKMGGIGYDLEPHASDGDSGKKLGLSPKEV